MGYVGLPVAVESWIIVGPSMGGVDPWAGYEDQPQPQCKSNICPATSSVCQDLPLRHLCLFWGLWEEGTLLQVNVRALWPPGESAPRPGWPQLANSSAGMSSAGQGNRESGEWVRALPQAVWRGVSNQKKWRL